MNYVHYFVFIFSFSLFQLLAWFLQPKQHSFLSVSLEASSYSQIDNNAQRFEDGVAIAKKSIFKSINSGTYLPVLLALKVFVLLLYKRSLRCKKYRDFVQVKMAHACYAHSSNQCFATSRRQIHQRIALHCFLEQPSLIVSWFVPRELADCVITGQRYITVD